VSVTGHPVPLTFVDTLESTAFPVITVANAGGRRNLLVGELSPLDSTLVTVSTTVPGMTWFLSRRRASTVTVRGDGVSGGHAVWSHRTTAPLFAVDTVRACDFLTFSCSGGFYTDTLIVNDVQPQLRVTLRSPTSATLTRGTAMRTDSAGVELLGTSVATKAWTAFSNSLRISFHARDAFTATASGTGSAWLKWTYDVSRLAPGIYVDTITVRADGIAGSPARIVDTLHLGATRSIVGDVDGDGAIVSADAQLILRSLVGLPLPPGAVVTPNGDANCDGSVNAADALVILQADLQMPQEGSCLARPTAAGSPRVTSGNRGQTPIAVVSLRY
jgi:hypothetical protein